MKKIFIRKRHCEGALESALARSNPFLGRSPRPAHTLMQVLVMTIFILVFASCSKPLPTLDGIDLKQWKDDKNGCHHFREKMIGKLTSQKNKLQGLSEDDIISLLGRPDQNELYKRNQKFFYYSLEPSAKCAASVQSSKKLSVRFTAMGFAKEVVVE